MKKFTKIFAIVLTIAMLASLAIPVYAADDGSITINNAIEGQVYTVYQMAELESYDATTGTYSYKVTDGWESFFTSNGISVQNGYVHYSNDIGPSRLPAFANAAIAWAGTLTNPVTFTKTAAVEADENDTTTVKFDLPLGYYCVESSVGTVCMLTNADPDGTINEKNPPTTISKWVEEDSTEDWEKLNDDSIGSTVNYMLQVKKEAGGINYVMTDTMSAGLTFDPESVNVYFGTTTWTEGTEYVLYVNDGVTETWEAVLDTIFTEREAWAGADDENYDRFMAMTFIIDIENTALNTVPVGTFIYAEYQAIINEDAVIGVEGNPNKATLIYGRFPYVETDETMTITYVWDVKILKYATSGTTEIPLAGATFEIYESTTNDVAVATACWLKDITEEDGVPTYMHIHNPVDTTDLITEITTDETGRFNLVGFDSGKYWLRETEAPQGYNKLGVDIEIDIIEEGDYTTSATLNYKVSQADSNGVVKVLNQTGVILPETGGTGTVIFIAIGTTLVLAMGVLLVVKKRMSKVVFTR